MSTLSLCMIVKNEQDVLQRCLSSCKNLFDEIIIVDTGSTDNTIQIAQKFTNKIYHFNWCDDFSKARNFAFSKSTSKYIMWLDADDVIPSKSLKKLLELKPNLTADTYMLKYDIAFANGKPTFSYFRERIVKNCPLATWNGVVHECITPFGKVEKLNISIHHKKQKIETSTRNLDIYKKTSRQRPLTPREQYYYARELFDHKRYRASYTAFKKFVNSKQGWVENVIDALYIMSKIQGILGNTKTQIECLSKTFSFDSPRANICCALGDVYLKQQKCTQAIEWYKIATTCPDVSQKGGFVESQYYNYYPYLQMCYCYFCLGDNQTAYAYNKKAEKFCCSQITKHNNEFFNKVLKM